MGKLLGMHTRLGISIFTKGTDYKACDFGAVQYTSTPQNNHFYLNCVLLDPHVSNDSDSSDRLNTSVSGSVDVVIAKNILGNKSD